MNKKIGLIYKLGIELFIMAFLIFSFINNGNFLNFMILPFIICISGDVVKNILLIKGVNVNNRFFEKNIHYRIFIVCFSIFNIMDRIVYFKQRIFVDNSIYSFLVNWHFFNKKKITRKRN